MQTQFSLALRCHRRAGARLPRIMLDMSRTPPETIRTGEAVAVLNGEMTAPIFLEIAGGHAAILSSRGPHKESPNEDAAAVIPLGATSGILAVADGCGGHAAGEHAARLAIEILYRRLTHVEAPENGLREAILDAFEEASSAIGSLGLGAGTTLAVAEIQPGVVRTYHTGDTDILVIGQRGRTKLQTLAHTPTAYAREAGLLDESSAMHHEDRNLISNSVGSADMRVEVGSVTPLALRDTLLLASDGVADNLWSHEIIDLIRTGPLARSAERIARACRDRMQSQTPGQPSKPDDLTFILFRRFPAGRTERAQRDG